MIADPLRSITGKQLQPSLSVAEHLQLDPVGSGRNLDLDFVRERLSRRLAPLADALCVSLVVKFGLVRQVRILSNLGFGVSGFGVL